MLPNAPTTSPPPLPASRMGTRSGPRGMYPTFCSHSHFQTTSATRLRRQFSFFATIQIPRNPAILPIGCARPPGYRCRSGLVLGAYRTILDTYPPSRARLRYNTTSPPSPVSVEIHRKDDSLNTNIKARRYAHPDRCGNLNRHQLTPLLPGLMLCASVDEEQVRSSPLTIPSAID